MQTELKHNTRRAAPDSPTAAVLSGLVAALMTIALAGCSGNSHQQSVTSSSSPDTDVITNPAMPAPPENQRPGYNPGSPMTMPNLIGMTPQQALATMTAAGWTAGQQNFHSQTNNTTPTAPHIIYSQAPASGAAITTTYPVTVQTGTEVAPGWWTRGQAACAV